MSSIFLQIISSFNSQRMFSRRGTSQNTLFTPAQKMHDAAFVAKDATVLPVVLTNYKCYNSVYFY